MLKIITIILTVALIILILNTVFNGCVLKKEGMNNMNFSCSKMPDKLFLPDFGNWNLTEEQYTDLYSKTSNKSDISLSVVCGEGYEVIPPQNERAYMKCSDGNWNWYLESDNAIDASKNLPCCREIHWDRFKGKAANVSCSRTKDDLREYYSQVDPCGNLYYDIRNEEIKGCKKGVLPNEIINGSQYSACPSESCTVAYRNSIPIGECCPYLSTLKTANIRLDNSKFWAYDTCGNIIKEFPPNKPAPCGWTKPQSKKMDTVKLLKSKSKPTFVELIYEYLIKPSEPTENPLQTQMNIANVSGAITNILNAKPDISDVNNLEQSNNLGKNAVNQSSTLGSSSVEECFPGYNISTFQ